MFFTVDLKYTICLQILIRIPQFSLLIVKTYGIIALCEPQI